jgi:hypothetical protein
MTPELTALALAGLLLSGQFLRVSVLANMELGSRYFTSPRDRAPDRELLQRRAPLKRACETRPAWTGRNGETNWGPRARSAGFRWVQDGCRLGRGRRPCARRHGNGLREVWGCVHSGH